MRAAWPPGLEAPRGTRHFDGPQVNPSADHEESYQEEEEDEDVGGIRPRVVPRGVVVGVGIGTVAWNGWTPGNGT